jgi:hypothetical protein
MFRALTTAYEYVVGSQVSSVESSVDRLEEQSQMRRCPSETNTRKFTGKVTQMSARYGMIDDSVYFGLDTVVGGVDVEVREGDRVRCTAVRLHSDAGWRATRVELENRKNWLETRPSESKKENVCPHESDLTVEQQSIVGTITKMSRHGGGIINGDAAVFSQDAVVKGYVPCVGDWVRADVQCCISAVINIDEDQWTATKVQPLRVKTVEGRIRALFGGYGFIDEDIYFCFKVCCSPYQPRKGDMVKVTVIECSYKQTHWRAIRLEPSRGRVVNPRSIYYVHCCIYITNVFNC